MLNLKVSGGDKWQSKLLGCMGMQLPPQEQGLRQHGRPLEAPDMRTMQPGMAAGAQADQGVTFGHPGSAVVYDDGALAGCRLEAELAAVAIPGQYLGAKACEITAIPAAPGIAAGAVSPDQLSFCCATATPQGSLATDEVGWQCR